MADSVVTVETMIEKRREILLGCLVFGGLWQVTRVVDDLTRDGRLLPHPWLAILGVAQLVGWIGWAVALSRLISFTKRLKANPVVAEAVGDEFYQQVRLKAFALACGGAVVCQAALIVASLAYPLTARVGADVTIFVTCTTAFAAFLRLEQA